MTFPLSGTHRFDVEQKVVIRFYYQVARKLWIKVHYATVVAIGTPGRAISNIHVNKLNGLSIDGDEEFPYSDFQ